MTKSETEAWGLVAFGAVIIVLLLLPWSTVVNNTNVTLTPVNTDQPQQGVVVPVQVSGGEPIQNTYVFPNLGNPNINLTILTGNPCACGCEGQQQIQEVNLTSQIDTLNQQLQSNTIANEASYFAGLPEDDLFATNATGIGAFTSDVGLPNPILPANVTTPATQALVGGGSLSYTFVGASPYPAGP